MGQAKKLICIMSAAAVTGVLAWATISAISNGTRDEWQNLTINGGIALRSGQEKIAEDYFVKALKKAESESQKPNEEELITSLQNLGICCEKAGRYDEAARLYTRMAMITQSKYGSRSPEYEEVLKILKRTSIHSPLLQQCPNFTIDEKNYSKI